MLYNIIVSSYQRDNNRTNGRIGDAVMRRLRRGYAVRLGGIRRSNAAEITIRLTQQGMVISDTAGNGNFASLIPISYCANHDLPSPTDFHFQFTAHSREW